MLKFEILGADGSVSEIVTSEKSTIKVGKLATNDLKISEPSVGPVHAQIDVIDATTCKVKDRGSIGGTFINESQVEKSKEATFVLGSVLRFGKVSVRVSSDAASVGNSEVEGATITASAGVVEALAADADSSATVAIPAPPVAPAAAGGVKLEKPPSKGNFASNKGGSFGGFNNAPAAVAPKKIIRRKRPVSFERRFLSEKNPNGDGKLEIAMVWNGNVISMREYNRKDAIVYAGASSSKQVQFKIEDRRLGAQAPIAFCRGGRWYVCFTNDYDGFLVSDASVLGQEKLSLRDARPNDSQGITIAKINNVVTNGALCIPIDGKTRAKLQFGEVSVLLHIARPSTVVVPFFGAVSTSLLGSVIASFVLHMSIFTIMLFATDRVDALMIDRILTTSRFADALVQEEEEDQIVEEEKPDEEEPEDPIEQDDSTVEIDNEPTPFAANTPSNNVGESNGAGMSRSEAEGAAQATGLLAQANAMNSMLAVGANLDNMDLDWSAFDANAAAASAGYGMGMIGGGGGGAAMGGFGAGGFGPGGPSGRGGAVGAAARSHTGNLGAKGEGAPKMKALNPDVSGSLDKRVIQKIVRQHMGELRACYEKELARTKGLNGRIAVTWLVGADGNVANALVTETTMKNKTVESCVANSIKHWRFPRPNGGAACKVVYPFVFEAGSGDK